MWPDEHGETVTVIGAERRSPYGALLGYETVAEIPHCVVSPKGATVEDGVGMVSGEVNSWQVAAPMGTHISEGDRVLIRGEIFTVDYPPFDYSVGRRPVLATHSPKVVFTASRGEAHDHLG